MFVNYTIYQLPVEQKYIRQLFHSIAEDKINLEAEGYKETYKGFLDYKNLDSFDENSHMILEDLYELLNINHPIDYKGHSLSVSDIVEINNRYFHCQDSGWKEVFLTNENKILDRYLFGTKVTESMMKDTKLITNH